MFDVTNFSTKKIYKNNLETEKRIIFVSLLLLLFALEFVINVWECLFSLKFDVIKSFQDYTISNTKTLA